MRVLLTDHLQPDVELERSMLAAADIDMVVAQCCTSDEVIDAAGDAESLFVQYAPITRRVIESLPGVKLITINAVGVDNIDVVAAREHGVWVCNVPNASVNEVATHALAMALSLIRHLPWFDQSVRECQWQPEAVGSLRRPSTLTLGGLGPWHDWSGACALSGALFQGDSGLRSTSAGGAMAAERAPGNARCPVRRERRGVAARASVGRYRGPDRTPRAKPHEAGQLSDQCVPRRDRRQSFSPRLSRRRTDRRGCA